MTDIRKSDAQLDALYRIEATAVLVVKAWDESKDSRRRMTDAIDQLRAALTQPRRVV